MTWKHAFVICFALAVVALCGLSPTCAPSLSRIGDLALVAIGAVSGNAMAEKSEAKHAKEQAK